MHLDLQPRRPMTLQAAPRGPQAGGSEQSRDQAIGATYELRYPLTEDLEA